VPAPKPRRYRQDKRAASAAETRRKVIEAARQLLLSGDFQDVSVEAIAERAEVGRTTVYQQFENKQGLLQALELAVSERAGVENLLEVLQQPDALASLRAAFEVGGAVWARERAMFRKLFGLANVDADLRVVMEEKDSKRKLLVRMLVDKLALQRKLRAGVSRERAFQVLWLLTSFQNFDAASQVAASPEAAARLLFELCQLALLAPLKKK
jgi:AcrR family transcriptional regulator